MKTKTNSKKIFAKPVIGLTGQIAAGKSLVASMLGDLGCAVINADLLTHEILEEKSTKKFLAERFGEKVISSTGSVDRRALGAIVFADLASKEALEAYIHPLVIDRQRALVRKYQVDDNFLGVVLEVPLLFETGLQKECNWIIVVESELSIRQSRVAMNRSWSEEELSSRERYLYSIYLKRCVADSIVFNNSTIEACRQQVETIFSRIISSMAH